MKKINYKNKIGMSILGAMTYSLMLAQALIPTSSSEVTGTINTGLGNTSVNGIVISAPITTPVAGTYTSAQTVILSSSGSLNIQYTTNGDTPTCSTGTTYSSTISVASTQTIKAIACYANNISSPVSSSLYTINIPVSTTPSGGGGGGGGGGMSTYFAPVNTGGTTTTATTTTEQTNGGANATSTKPKGQVLGASAFNFYRDLTIGSRGNDVIELQKILIAGGFLKTVNPTNYFGQLTKSALMAWQKKNNVTPNNGIFSGKTREMFNYGTIAPTVLFGNNTNSTSTATTTKFIFLKDLSLGSKNTDVIELQKILIAGGFLNLTTPTDYFGNLTKIALIKYQVKYAISPASGYFGKITRAFINK